MKRVSAIIPVYNGEATIAQAIDSALAQRFDGAMEVVAVNDGSTDSTAAILEGYGSRIKVVTQPNRGLAAARNAGVAASSGAYLAFLDADDMWLPDYLAKNRAALDKNPKAVLAFADIIAVDATGARIEHPPVGCVPTMDDLLRRWSGIIPSAVVMRRSAFDLCGGFCEEFRGLGYEDDYMWLVARERGEFEYVPEPLAIYREAPLPVKAVKYQPGFPVFVRLVRRRYGRAADRLIDHEKSYLAPGLVQAALQQMDSGDRRGALRTWLMLLRLKPSYVLTRMMGGSATVRRAKHPVRALRNRVSRRKSS
ncbi:MAG: glycosyltransferase [Candidatus Binataceae bacterium]